LKTQDNAAINMRDKIKLMALIAPGFSTAVQISRQLFNVCEFTNPIDNELIAANDTFRPRGDSGMR
jgi:hypothetical protein